MPIRPWDNTDNGDTVSTTHPQWSWGYGPDMTWPPPAVPQQPIPGANPAVAQQAMARMQGLLSPGMNYSQMMPALYASLMQPYNIPTPQPPVSPAPPAQSQWGGLLAMPEFQTWLGEQGYGLLSGSGGGSGGGSNDSGRTSGRTRGTTIRDQNWYDQRGKG